MVNRNPCTLHTRKDPFASSKNGNAATNTSDADETIYGQALGKLNRSVTIGDNIKNPHTFYWNNDGSYQNVPNNTPYDNSWNATNKKGVYNTTADIVKTIYDPCPMGYTVAPVNAFVNFTTKNWDSTNKGHTLGGCWFPAMGYRAKNSGVTGFVGTNGCYIQAVPYDITNGRQMSFDSNNPNPSIGANRSFGYSVRPVAEK